MAFLSNPPVEDAAGGEADKSLCYAQKIILGILPYMPAVIFFACLDLEQKFSFMDGH